MRELILNAIEQQDWFIPLFVLETFESHEVNMKEHTDKLITDIESIEGIVSPVSINFIDETKFEVITGDNQVFVFTVGNE